MARREGEEGGREGGREGEGGRSSEREGKRKREIHVRKWRRRGREVGGEGTSQSHSVIHGIHVQ